MSKKSHFRGRFDKQHGKWDQTVLESEFTNFTVFVKHCESY